MKGINFIKIFKVKDLYKLYIIIKDKVNKYKFYIYLRKHLLDLVYFDIIGFFDYSYREGKYFITFLNNYNKRSKVEVLESKGDIYIAYLYYTAWNEQGNIKIHRFRINYSSKYSNYWFNNLRVN